MNLQPLYDLKERLEHAVIAGTGLIGEDFRLHRAIDGMAPLAASNPVFGKITAAAKLLLQCPECERSTRLLDVLSLVDAVVYTQGTVSVAGELLALELGSGTYVPASYGTLQPLMTALSGTGSGRTTLIRDAWQSHPKYFRDFRVLPLVVGALGDNYAELADMIAGILTRIGPEVVPLLKSGFDPEGKTPMARRIRLMAQLTGNAENEWFRAILPGSSKEVREAVIESLGNDRENADLLLELCQTEKGKLKEAALHAAARTEDPRIDALLRKELKKKPGLITCLNGADSPLAADLAAEAMEGWLTDLLVEKTEYDHKDLERLAALTGAVCGKNSEKILNLWHWIEPNMDRFHGIIPDQNLRNCDMTAAEHLQKTLMTTLVCSGAPELLELGRELARKNRKWFLCCAVLADMAEASAAELYDRYAPFLHRNTLLNRETEAQKWDRSNILRALSVVQWNGEVQAFCATFTCFDSVTGGGKLSARKLDGFDPRWMTLLTDPAVKLDGGFYPFGYHQNYHLVEPVGDYLISSLTDPGNPAVCAAAGSWLYQRLLETGNLGNYFHPLLNCGWKNWSGVLAHCAKKKGQVSYGMCCTVLKAVPMTNKEKAAELRALNDLVTARKLSTQYHFWPTEAVNQQIAMLEADEHYEF